jgi:adenylate cyclase
MQSDDPIARINALFRMSSTPERAGEVLGLLEHAAAETAQSAAYAAIAHLCRYLNRWENIAPAELDGFEQVIQRALGYDPHYYLAFYAQGFLCRARGHHPEALAAFDETIRYAPPNFARAHAQKGEELVYLGRFDDGIAEAKRALEINPNSKVRGYFHWVIGRAYFFKEDYPEAVAWLQRSVRAWGSVWFNRAYLLAAHAQRQDKAAARRVRRALIAKFPDFALARIGEYEGANPCTNADVVKGRERFHQGLRLAGL